MTLIQAQERFIDRINSRRVPGRRSAGLVYARQYRAAARELRAYLTRIGVTDEQQQDLIVGDARDMAKLQLLCND